MSNEPRPSSQPQDFEEALRRIDAIERRLSTINKPGTILLYSGTNPPDFSLPCDGTAVNRTLYAGLFTEIGTTYGVGDGSTTFNVPDLRDRVPVGVSGTITRGSTGGAKTHNLAASEMSAHSHIVGLRSDGSIIGGNVQLGSSGNTFAFDSAGTGGKQTGGGANGRSWNEGSNGAHNNMQPYIGMNWAIQT
jgi:microcystin-dependent protein